MIPDGGGHGKLQRLPTGGWKLSGCAPHVAIRLKQVFASIAKGDAGPWLFDDSDDTAADLEWFCQRYPMDMRKGERQALAYAASRWRSSAAERRMILSPNYKPKAIAGLKDGQVARGYQLQFLDLFRKTRRMLLADEVGLGKTYEAILACLLEDARPACIVVPLQVQQQWADKIGEFTDLSVHQVTTTRPYTLPQADVYLFRYTNLHGWVDVLNAMDIGLACWDEVAALRTGTTTAKGMASRVLHDRARYRLGLSATPIYNRGAEIWEVMQFIAPGVLGSWAEFGREWLGGSLLLTAPDACGTYLRDQGVMLRRTRQDVHGEVPAVNKVLEFIDYSHHTMDGIAARARALAEKAAHGSFEEAGTAARELDMLVRQTTGIAKAKAVCDYVRILVETGNPVLLVGWHREVYRIWNTELADLKPVMHTGSETPKQKREALLAFKTGRSPILIMSLRSGEGVDGLQDVCQTIVFGELDWSPEVHHQLIGRLDRERRDGQVNQVLAVFLAIDEGSDPPIIELLGLKASQADGLLNPERGLMRADTEDSRLRALIARYADLKEAA